LKSGAVGRKFGTNESAEYTVKAGDSLSTIAKAYSTTVAAIRAQNDVQPGRLPIGMKLMIRKPSGSAAESDFTGRQRWVYQELRDRKTALFIDHLPQGVWQVSYDYRAEVPGQFHGLPVLGQAMYVPEIRANSAEIRVTVEDAK